MYLTGFHIILYINFFLPCKFSVEKKKNAYTHLLKFTIPTGNTSKWFYKAELSDPLKEFFVL